jgi:hypothetical protein
MSSGYLSKEQVALLLKPIHPQRVLQLKGMSYIEGYDVRAELNRVFGFARWDQEILDQAMICEENVKTNAGRDAWYVVYRTRMRLQIHAPDGSFLTHYDGSHVGESTHPVRGEAHGNAITNSETYALRRCAINLGDQFGLGLYNKGSLDAIVRWTLIGGESADTDDIIQVAAEEPQFPPNGENPNAVTESSAVSQSARRASPGPARTRSGKLLPDFPHAQAVADAAFAVDDPERVLAYYKAAGPLGYLKDEVAHPESGEKIQLSDCLVKRGSALRHPKSPGAAPEGVSGISGDQ